MSDNSSIEWTDATWNPVRGCTEITSGCANCYARTFSERFRGVPGHPYEQGFDLRLVPEKIREPLTWKRPRRVFVNSMSDLFHKDVPDDFIVQVQDTMLLADQHTFQILTKRAGRMKALLDSQLSRGALASHIWWGTSVENRRQGLPRLEELKQSKASIKFLSVEPLLEDLGEVDWRGIDWVIVGGESGAGAREMRVEWVRKIRDQCLRDGVPFFFKQWGGVQKKKHGRELDGRTHDEFPQILTAAG